MVLRGQRQASGGDCESCVLQKPTAGLGEWVKRTTTFRRPGFPLGLQGCKHRNHLPLTSTFC
jgi:hypothetical protein